MEYPIERTIDGVIAASKRPDEERKEAILIALLQPLLDVLPSPTTLAFSLLMATLCQAHATLTTVREAFNEHVNKGNMGRRVGSQRSVFREAGLGSQYGYDPATNLDYNEAEFNTAFDAVFRAGAEAYFAVAGTKDRGYILLCDGTARPFYGLSFHFNPKRTERWDELSIAGRNTQGAIRDGQREYPGTRVKHAYFQVSIHIHDTLESLPILVRRGPVCAQFLDDMMRQVDALSLKPLAFMADKEFCNAAKLRDLRPWCDRNRIVMALPLQRYAPIKRIAIHAWNKSEAKPLPASGAEPMFWHATRHEWPKKDAPRFNVVTLYFREQHKRRLLEDDHAREILALPDGWYSCAFYTNIQVTEANAWWFLNLYPDRWHAENLHARHQRWCGKSNSSGMYRRALFYNLSLSLFSAYAIWRTKRMHERGLRLHDPRLGHPAFFGDLRLTYEARLRDGTPPPQA